MYLRVAGLRLKAVARHPLRNDVFVLHLVAHFVADVGVGAFVRGSAVSAFCDGHVVDILSVTVGCDGCANGCSVHVSRVGLVWACHPGCKEALLSLRRPPPNILSPQSQLFEGGQRPLTPNP